MSIAVPRAAEQHLGRAVEARLDVAVDRLPVAARGAKVDELDGGALGVRSRMFSGLRSQWMTVTSQREEAQRLQDLLAELPDEVERHPLEGRVRCSRSYRLYESISKTRHWWPRNMKCSWRRTMQAVSVGSFLFRNCSSISVFACCRNGFFD